MLPGRRALGVGIGVGVLALVPGCPLLEVQVEVAEVCITYAGMVEGSPGLTEVAAEYAFEDLGQLGELAARDAELRFVRAELRAVSGLTSFAFVQSAQVTIASGDPASTLPTVVAYECAEGACLAEGATLAVPASFQDDAVGYLRTGSIIAGLRVTGALPPQAWALELDLCFQGKVSEVVAP